MRNAYSQNYVYLIKKPGDQYQVILELDDRSRSEPHDLALLYILTTHAGSSTEVRHGAKLAAIVPMRIFPTRSELRTRLKRVGGLIASALLIKTVWVLAFRVDGGRLLAGQERDDLMARRAWLVRCVVEDRAGLADMPFSLPRRFQGEWAIGTYSMLAAALTNLAQTYPETHAESARLVAELIDGALRSDLRAFDTEAWGSDALKSLDTPQGHAGYLGHLCFMLGAYRFTGGDARHDALLRGVAGALARRVSAAPTRSIETYPGETYLPDNVVVAAALRNADRALRTSAHAAAADAWLTAARSRFIDPKTGLIAFSIRADGSIASGARGSGTGWNSFYLPFVDEAFARAQFERCEAVFVARRLGLTGILEYPPGVAGAGDVDSGPVILGLSTSGTGFAVAGARRSGRARLAGQLLLTAEVVGSSVQWGGRRRYLLAPLVGEAIMLAMKSAVPWQLPAGP